MAKIIVAHCDGENAGATCVNDDAVEMALATLAEAGGRRYNFTVVNADPLDDLVAYLASERAAWDEAWIRNFGG